MRLTITRRVVALAAVGLAGLGATLAVTDVTGHRARSQVERMRDYGSGLSDQWNADLLHDDLRADVMAGLYARNADQHRLFEVDDVGDHGRTMISEFDAAARQAPSSLRPDYASTRPDVLAYTRLAASILQRAGTDRAGAAALLPQYYVLFDGLEQRLGTIDRRYLAAVGEQSRVAQSSLAEGQRLVELIGLLAGIAFVLMSLLVVRAIRGPLEAMVGVLRRVAARDLGVEVPSARDDEIGDMAEALADALTAIRGTIRATGDGITTLTSASREMSSISGDLGSSAESTAGQAESASAAAREVSASASQMSVATEEMDSSIREIAARACEAADIVAEATRTADVTSAAVNRLLSASEEIGQIISSITGIAEQTNLLALNATIEAARAGEAGKGFAVVAGEVKALALETAKATDDVTSRISAIQQITGEATDAIRGIGSVIGRISENQSTIAAAVEEQTTATAEITRMIANLSGHATRIADSVEGIASSTISTAQGAGATRAAATNVSGVITGVSRLISQFRY